MGEARRRPRAIRRIERQGAIAIALPRHEVPGQPRHAGLRPEHREFEESRVAGTEEHAHPVDRNAQEHDERVLDHEEDFHGQNHVHEEREIRDAPTGRRTGGCDEQQVRRQSFGGFGHDL